MIQEYMSEICQIGIISYEFYELHVGSWLMSSEETLTYKFVTITWRWI